jgi:hypothetical protein
LKIVRLVFLAVTVAMASLYTATAVVFPWMTAKDTATNFAGFAFGITLLYALTWVGVKLYNLFKKEIEKQ